MNNISSVKESGLVEQVNPKDFEFNLVLKWKDIPDEGHCATWIEYWDNLKVARIDEKRIFRVFAEAFLETHRDATDWGLNNDETGTKFCLSHTVNRVERVLLSR